MPAVSNYTNDLVDHQDPRYVYLQLTNSRYICLQMVSVRWGEGGGVIAKCRPKGLANLSADKSTSLPCGRTLTICIAQYSRD